MKKYNRVAAYVDLDAIEANVEALKAKLKAGTQIAATIKADGYGHGAVGIGQFLEEKSYIWGFLTATIEEALVLRQAGICKPVLILGYPFPEAYEKIVEKGIRATVFQYEAAKALSKEAVRQKKTVSVHVKVDTGMSRLGLPANPESVEVIRRMAELPCLRLEGLFTHFARADEADKTSAYKQLSDFLEFAEACKAQGITFPMYHCSNSAGIMEMPEANLNMVRAGIALYGLYPSEEMEKDAVRLTPAMELKTHIVYVKEIEAGTAVSYGGLYTAPEVRRIATIPVGYADGYPRSLSNKGYVLIAGKKAPVRGRVCMDQMMVDVTDIPEAETGMEVTLFGKDQGVELPLEKLSELSGRFNYEFVCNLTKRIPRIYRYQGKVVGIEDCMACE